MPFEDISDEEVKVAAIAVGRELHAHEGKKRYYSNERVREAIGKVSETIDMLDVTADIIEALFTMKSDFDASHQGIKEVCDYGAAREKAVHAVTDGASESWFDVDLSWLEWPDFDLPNVFDLLDL